MSYAEKNLISGEAIRYRAYLHWIAMMKRMLLAAVLAVAGIGLIIASFSSKTLGSILVMAGLVLILACIVVLVIAVVLRRAAEFVITNKRVIIKVGFLHKRTIEIFLTKIESVEVEQSLLGQCLHYGSIAVKGTGGTTEPFPQIADPFEFRRQVQEQEQREMGLVGESARSSN